MFEGKTGTAIKLITGHKYGGLLYLSDPVDPSNPGHLVCDVLRDKHPPAQPLSQDCLASDVSESSPFHPMAFDGGSIYVRLGQVMDILSMPLRPG